MRKMLLEPARELRVAEGYDVAVCGGGVAGIAAALAAARCGAKTVLLEREYLAGGLATAGLIAVYLPLCDGEGRQVSFGIAEELLRLSVRRGFEGDALGFRAWVAPDASVTREDRVRERFRVRFNPQLFAVDAERLLLDAGVTLRYGSAVCAAAVEEGRVTHLVVESKSGRTAIAVGRVVDCTGDADIVHQAGEKEALFSQGNVLAAWYCSADGGTTRLHMVGACDLPEEEKKNGRAPEYLSGRRFGGLDAAELTEQVVLSHENALRHFLKEGPYGERHVLCTLPTIPQIRMTRRIDGEYCMGSGEAHREFADSVGLYADWRKRGPVFELPFSTLHGSRVRNLICAGRCISVTDAQWDVTRVIPVCAVSGQAAGTAAALFDDFTRADVARLQKTLSENGVILRELDLP